MMNQGTTSPPSPPQQQQQQQHHHRRNGLVERCSTLRACDPCKRKKKVCNGQRPCSHCTTTTNTNGTGGKKEASASCVYSVVPDHARGVFTTSNARRLSSGSACETCRRRKTKCDGASPCGYCASNQLECVNNHHNTPERRKRMSLANIAKPCTSPPPSIAAHLTTTTYQNPPLFSSPLSNNNTAGGVPSTTTTTTQRPTTSTTTTTTNTTENQAMERIEDRLQRIEKLMTAFSSTSSDPSGAITATNYGSSVYRKLSTPQPSYATSSSPYIRPQRHSVQGISVAKEQVELRTALAMSRARGTEHQSPPLASSMLNLTLSPSSSTSSSTTPADDMMLFPDPSGNNNMPSFMDQLSKRTFTSHAAMEYCTVHYPIYPLTPPPPPQ